LLRYGPSKCPPPIVQVSSSYDVGNVVKKLSFCSCTTGVESLESTIFLGMSVRKNSISHYLSSLTDLPPISYNLQPIDFSPQVSDRFSREFVKSIKYFYARASYSSSKYDRRRYLKLLSKQVRHSESIFSTVQDSNLE